VTAAGPFFSGTPQVREIYTTLADYFVPETTNDGSVYAKWISRKFSLENASDGIEIKLSAVFYDTNDIRVYYRTQTATSAGELTDYSWIPFNEDGRANDAEVIRPRSSDVVDPRLLEVNDWQTLTYSVQDIPRFKAVQIKIVMTSDNPAKAPLIDDLRMVCSE
jgi:hypothetical protein